MAHTGDFEVHPIGTGERLKALEEALTPSAETKAAYIGEFKFTIELMQNYEPNEPRIQFAQWIDLYGTGGRLCAPWQPDSTPHANGWLTLEKLAAINASAIEARRAETLGSVADESAGPQDDAQEVHP